MREVANFAERNIKNFLKFARPMDRRQILLLISEIEKMTEICKNQWQFKTKPARETLIFEKKYCRGNEYKMKQKCLVKQNIKLQWF